MRTDVQKDAAGVREAKQARFNRPQAGSRGPSPLVLVACVVVALTLIGGTVLALTRPWAKAQAQANASSSEWNGAPTGSQGLLVSAATLGHDPYPAVEATDGAVRLSLSTFDDFQAHFYTFMYQGQPIEFFVLKSKDGVVRAAFNACDVCFPAKKGYHQEGDEMVCNNCGSRFPSNLINEVRGGCNPAPLTRTVEGNVLLIQVQDLAQGLSYF
jgi:hypothetical protein